MTKFQTDLQRALPGKPKITGEQYGTAQRLDIVWKNGGRARVDVYRDRLYWQELNVRGLGIHPEVGHAMAAFLAKRGFRYMEMAQPGNEKALDAIVTKGLWEPRRVQYGPSRFSDGYRWTF